MGSVENFQLQDGDQVACESDRDGFGYRAAGGIASVPTSHRERDQNRRGAGDGSEHNPKGEQEDDGARGTADSRGGGARAVGGCGEEVRDALREQHEAWLVLSPIEGVQSEGVSGSGPGLKACSSLFFRQSRVKLVAPHLQVSEQRQQGVCL